ncbi:hypothetical protein BDN72DRAFT_846849 [Pluteus cervinus]|uniref:Uncharacterized protein n=1 Tax=Pluteus cervinus TaxID=181527 RepID=A0ACD3AEK7_9AGAR|nr:hypothetical protein BDN72DRAFT_846849 [Pluteus cervinus]
MTSFLSSSIPLLNTIPVLIPPLFFHRFKAQGVLKRGRDVPLATVPIHWGRLQTKLKSEWYVGNIVAVCLLFANANLLRIHDVSSQQATRTATLMSLLSALFSFMSGCANTVFLLPSVQKIYETALERARHPKIMFWNLWVLITLPFLHLTWAVIQFSYVIFTYLFTEAGPIPENQRSYVVLVAGLGSLACTLGVYYSVRASPAQFEEGGDHELHQSLMQPENASSLDPVET